MWTQQNLQRLLRVRPRVRRQTRVRQRVTHRTNHKVGAQAAGLDPSSIPYGPQLGQVEPNWGPFGNVAWGGLTIQGSHRKSKNLENENGLRKVMTIDQKSWNFTHRI